MAIEYKRGDSARGKVVVDIRHERTISLIFITAKFRVRPEDADAWPAIRRAFTEATRAEPGCLWFDWSRSLDDSTEYVLVEAFRDGDAASAHVTSEHFRSAQCDQCAHGETGSEQPQQRRR